MRLLITGSRHAKGHDHGRLIRAALAQTTIGVTGVTLIHGRCPYGGVDLIADRMARRWGWDVEEHPADVTPDGKILGPARNARMVAAGADLCLAFPDPRSRGTWDCLRKAANAGIPGRVYPLETS
jgi:hypothetical protein